MRLEYVPIGLGILVLLIAAGILFDAASPKDHRPFRERRRRKRAELDVPGEWMVGLGIACLGAALIGGDGWRWTTIAVLSGIVLIVFGAILNRAYLREMLLFRGAARRSEEGEEVPPERDDEPRMRIR